MKKGYIYTLDVFIAVVMLIIGISILYYNFVLSNRSVYMTERLSEDIIGVLAYTQTTDLCTDVYGTCSCMNYPKLQTMVCGPELKDKETDLLSMLSEVIETGLFTGDDVKCLIQEIFVTKKVIDEKRFGFAVLYQGHSGTLLELYNTETYGGGCS